jgi:hypothetical protein
MHVPVICLTEARQAIMTKCQPRHEANAVRGFLDRARAEQTLSREQERITREVLARFEQQVHTELRQLDETIASLRDAQGLEVFPLNDKMLERAVNLSVLDLSLKPFDQAILAAVLVRAEELRNAGETDVCFCETDADLKPWDKQDNAKQPLTGLYAAASVWVYRNFKIRAPERPANWPDR